MPNLELRHVLRSRHIFTADVCTFDSEAAHRFMARLPTISPVPAAVAVISDHWTLPVAGGTAVGRQPVLPVTPDGSHPHSLLSSPRHPVTLHCRNVKPAALVWLSLLCA